MEDLAQNVLHVLVNIRLKSTQEHSRINVAQSDERVIFSKAKQYGCVSELRGLQISEENADPYIYIYIDR